MDSSEILVQPFNLVSAGDVVASCYNTAGDRLATCSTSGRVQVWGVADGDGSWEVLHSTTVTESPTSVAWAPAEHGTLLAVATAAGVVRLLHGPVAGNAWHWSGKLACGRKPVREVQFAPHQLGLLLAAASDDGKVHVHEAEAAEAIATDTSSGGDACGTSSTLRQWTSQGSMLASERGPCSCLCWRPFTPGVPPMLVASCSGGARVWCYVESSMSWQASPVLEAPPGSPSSAATALAWAPTLGRPHELLAAAFGTQALLFTVNGSPSHLQLRVQCALKHPQPVWRLEFNSTGNALATSLDGTPEIWIWMPGVTEGSWSAASRIAGSLNADVDGGTGMEH